MQLGSLATRRPPLLPACLGATDSPPTERGLRGHVVRAKRFRFSEEPGLGAEGAVLEVRVPQVRAEAPAGKRSGAGAVLSRPGAIGRGVRGFPPEAGPQSETVWYEAVWQIKCLSVRNLKTLLGRRPFHT